MNVRQELNILIRPELQKKEVKKRSLYYIAWKTEEGYESFANTYKYKIENGKIIFKETYKNANVRELNLDDLVDLKIKKVR